VYPPVGGARGRSNLGTKQKVFGAWPRWAWPGRKEDGAGRGGAGRGPDCFCTCVLLDSGEGWVEGLGHRRALSCREDGGAEWGGEAEVFYPLSSLKVRR
jgi:hypothetical protein